MKQSRIFYTKNNKIVAHEAISSRIPGMSSAFLNIPKRKDFSDDFDFQMARGNWRNTKFDDMKDRMKRLKADGYYLLHNHPSGNPDASQADVRPQRFHGETLERSRLDWINSRETSTVGNG